MLSQEDTTGQAISSYGIPCKAIRAGVKMIEKCTARGDYARSHLFLMQGSACRCFL